MADRKTEAIVLVRASVCLSGTTVDCGQTAGLIELIFGTDLPLPKRHHVLGGEFFRGGGIMALNFRVQWEVIGKFQAIVMKFCTAAIHGQKICLPKFSPIARKIW